MKTIEPGEANVKMGIHHDADVVQWLVSVDPTELPEIWRVEFHADDGSVYLLEGQKYGDFEGLYFRYPVEDLYAWLLPDPPGTIRVLVPDGSVQELRHHRPHSA